MRRLTNLSVVPPGGFTYIHAQTGTKFNHINFEVLKLNVKKFFIANSYPIGLLFDQELEDNVANNLHPDAQNKMSEVVTPSVLTAKRSINVSDVKMFLWTFLAWKKQNYPIVSQAEAERRAHICLTCPFNVKVDGCTSCSHFPQLLMEAKGAAKTSVDSQLGACSVCACSLPAAVWMPREIKTKYMPPAYADMLALNCWQRAENDPNWVSRENPPSTES